MLVNNTVSATVAVSDINKGKEFYGTTLGLKQLAEFPGGVAFQSGTGKLLVYQSDTAGKNQATSASWDVTDIQAIVSDLKAKGVNFEHYDMPETHLEGDVHVMGDMKAAWFKDPDGNILGMAQEPGA